MSQSTSPPEKGRFTADGEQFISLIQVAKELGWGWQRLARMRADCPYLDGQPLVPLSRRPPWSKNYAEVIPEAKFNELRQKVQEVKRGQFTYKDQIYLSRDSALRELRVSGAPPVNRSKLKNWYVKRCRHLDGAKLGGRRFNFKKGKGTSQFWPLEKDVLRIKASLFKEAAAKRKGLTSFPGKLRKLREQSGLSRAHIGTKLDVSTDMVRSWEVGRFKPSPQVAKALAKLLGTSVQRLGISWKPRKHKPLPQQLFDGVFRDPDGQVVAYNMRKAAEVSGFGEGVLRSFAKRLPPALEHLFPDRRLPSEQRLVPGTSACWQPSVRSDHLDSLAADFDKLLRDDKTRCQLRTSDEISDQHGLTTVRDHILVRRLLRTLAENRVLKAERTFRQSAHGARAWSNPLVYDLVEVNRLLAGRGLAEVAREFDAQPNGAAPPFGKGPPVPSRPAEQPKKSPPDTKPPMPKKKRGRPKGSENEAAKERRKQIVNLWESGAFPSMQMLAEHLGISRSLVSLALSDAD
jgi:DNA-binding transcriptional regulator YiaG